MKTSDFFEILKLYTVKTNSSEWPVDLKEITADSREVSSGTVFFCIKGYNIDGHKFISKALEMGASVVVGEDENDDEKYVQVISVQNVLKSISQVFYDFPDRKMKMIGVTGTNGKTSTTYIIENILQKKFNCGVIGTIGYKYTGKTIDAANTTPQNWKWYSLLNNMQKQGVSVVISEISSHAIEEERIEKTLFDVAVFTNLTRDHLDFHKNIDNYYEAKKKLFTQHLKEGGTAIINVDDDYGMKLWNDLPESMKKLRISAFDQSAELFIKIKNIGFDGSIVDFNINGKTKEIFIPLVGKFNIYNAAGAFAASQIFAGTDYCFDTVSESITVPGRLEKIGNNSIYIDYAHTPDALENVLSTIRGLNAGGRVITVFGAGGDRDKGKRPLMGEVASRLSDIIIITDDNPRTEDPETIISEIFNGCNSGNSVIEVIHDRKTAIRKAIYLKNRNDVILIAGKGAENYQITKEGKRFFSDKEEVQKYLEELQHVHNSIS